MARVKIVPFRRKRNGRTNYKRRLGLLQSGKNRLVVRRSNKNLVVQFAKYSQLGDRILVAVNSTALRKLGLKSALGNVPSSYLTGLLAGVKAKEKGIKAAILDIGLRPSTKGSRIYAAVKGVIDAGISIPCSEEVFPPKERIEGRHIEELAKKIKGDSGRFSRQFSLFIKNNVDPANISKTYNDIKQKIVSEK